MPEAGALLAPRIQEIAPSLFERLEVEPFDYSEIRVNLTNSLDGHFGAPHTDTMDGRFKMSFLYYFHREPKLFSGGDLLLYDGDTDGEAGYSLDDFTRIVHTNNLFVAFPCQYTHEITAVSCESKQFQDGRFAASGFLRVRSRVPRPRKKRELNGVKSLLSSTTSICG